MGAGVGLLAASAVTALRSKGYKKVSENKDIEISKLTERYIDERGSNPYPEVIDD